MSLTRMAAERLDPKNAPSVRRRLARPGYEVGAPHSRTIFGRANGRFRCECRRVHVWGRTAEGEKCKALKCWCGWWHVRKDAYAEARP